MASHELAPGAAPLERTRRRGLWTIGDQALSSAQSFAISLVVTHSVDLRAIGAFAVAFTAYQLLMAVNRPLNTDPLTVGFAASDRATQRPAASAATGGALVFGIVVAMGCGAVGWVFGGTIGPVLLAFAISVPAFLVQDAWRSVSFTEGRPGRAFVNDAVVLVALGPTCWVALQIRPNSAAGLVAAWGAATSVGALLGVVQARARPGVEHALRWWRTTLHLGIRMAGENIIAIAAYSAGLLATGVGAGVQELGRLRTAQVSLGAVSPVIIASSTIVAAEGSRLLARNPERFPQLIRLVAAGSALLTGAFVVFLVLSPPRLGLRLIGSSWEAAQPLVVASGAFLAAAGVTLAVSGALRALRRPGGALRARSIAAPVTAAGGVAGAFYGGAGPAMLGIAAGECLCALLTMLAYRKAWKTWRERPWPVGPLSMVAVESPVPQ